MEVIWPPGCGVVKKDDAVYEKLLGDSQVVIEPKLDGCRAILHFYRDGIRIFGRRPDSKRLDMPSEHTGNFPHLVPSNEVLRQLDGTILDGEILGPEKNFSTSLTVWGSLPENSIAYQAFNGLAEYRVFDVIFWKGKDLRSFPFSHRIRFLNDEYYYGGIDEELAFRLPSQYELNWLSHAYRTSWEKERFHGAVLEQGGEGVMLKDLRSPYGAGVWKCKKEMTEDCVIMGFTKGNGKYSDLFGAIELGQYDKGGMLIRVGKCSGMTDEIRRVLSFERKKHIGQVVEVKCQEKTKNGKLRHPRFISLRPDKPERGCVIT